ncbi:hypothetical protein F2Y37_18380 [Bacteroides caccae]|uniref:Uncharacterized protein n=1 Tax=Bacteroides caccae TaxID=47678 RepID=A0A6H9QD67_9BACE|nr:hypothetical protein F2Y37_18380 [Bacteroides caccae]KAA5478982.1 hypothetical protein F2Y33_22440 [Bacteroides caccae]KAA5480077.1 hypothetical protein F2Y39_05580 [Bacteroides caccae]RYU06574.1 hypothetical protein EAJ00_05560 [Bacteroides caccae]
MYSFIILLLIDLTSYTTNPENKTLPKQLYIREIKCNDRVTRKNGSKTRNLYKYRLLFTE